MQRQMVKGYKQKHEIDYDEIFALIARTKIICLLIFLEAQMKWQIHQLDVKSTFLNGFLEKKFILNNQWDT